MWKRIKFEIGITTIITPIAIAWDYDNNGTSSFGFVIICIAIGIRYNNTYHGRLNRDNMS